MIFYTQEDYQLYYGDIFLDVDHCSIVIDFMPGDDPDAKLEWEVLPDSYMLT